MRTVKRQLSGATIKIMPFITIKSGGPEVGLQGERMRAIGKHFPQLVPKIYVVGNTSYVMQTLESTKMYGPWNIIQILKPLWNCPEEKIYGEQPKFNPIATQDFLKKVDSPLLYFMPSYSYMMLRYGGINEATHGDPTHENTLLRNDEVCFIDWQPNRYNFRPPHRDVDIGRIMQSMLGWRNIGRRSPFKVAAARAIHGVYPDAWFWCAFNFERIRATANDSAMEKWCREQVLFTINEIRGVIQAVDKGSV